MAIGRQLSLAVTNDCGTAYILAAAETPLLMLFGPTSAAKLTPRATRNTALRAQDFSGEEMKNIPFDAVRDQLDCAMRGR
jgi:ADP-heptose:LPS heptosyltransferase